MQLSDEEIQKDKEVKTFFKQILADGVAMEKLSRTTTPYKRPSRDYFSTLSAYTYSHQHYSNEVSKLNEHDSNLGISFTRVTVNRHSCLTKPTDLEPILLRQMKVNNIHKGKYLQCYVMSEPYVVPGGAHHYLITDSEGKELEFMSIYNFSFDLRPKNAEDTRQILTKGSKLIIKEPYLKFVSLKRDFILRVDSPTDVVYVPDEIGLDFNKLMELGKQNFLKKKYLLALRYYTGAVYSKDSHNKPGALLNRSAVFLQLNNYHAAYTDAANSTSLVASEKGYYRMGSAAYSMRQFQRSVDSFKKCLEMNPSNKDASVELKRALARLEESRSGVYDFKMWLNKEEVDVADYQSPDIKLFEFKDGYKGVVAVRPIQKGALLAVSKCVSRVFNKELEKGKLSLDINSVNKRASEPIALLNFSRIIKKMQGNPELTKQIYELYAGPSYSRSTPIDESIVDVSRLEAIYQFNSFSTNQTDELNFEKLESGNTALFLFPSFFNHSCAPNLDQFFISDAMVISANRDIKENEELFICYNNEECYKKRKETLLRGWDFECNCQRCNLDKNDAFLEERISLVQDHTKRIRHGILKKDSKALQPNFIMYLKDTVSKEISKIRSLYEFRPDPPVDLTIPLKTLASLYAYEFDFSKAAETCEEIYEINKNCNWAFAFWAMVDAYILYEKGSMKKRRDFCHRRAKDLFFTGSEIYFNHIFRSVYEQKVLANGM